MARARRKSDLTISLFAFLSVLAGAMGVLIVVIVGQNSLSLALADQEIQLPGGVSTTQRTDPLDGSAGQRIPIFVECTARGVLIHNDGMEFFAKPVAESLETVEEIRDLFVLWEWKEEGLLDDDDRARLRRLEPKYADRASPLLKLMLELKAVYAGAAEKEKALKEPERAPRVIFEPVLPPTTAPAPKPKRYIVLLVRPRGVEAYDHCYDMAEKSKIDVGKDALLGLGKVVFTSQGRPVAGTIIGEKKTEDKDKENEEEESN